MTTEMRSQPIGLCQPLVDMLLDEVVGCSVVKRDHGQVFLEGPVDA